MKYVLDSSVGFKWFLFEADTPKARKLRDDYHRGLVELIVPDVYPLEIIHALTRAERTGRITPQEGSTLVVDLLQTLPILHGSLPLLPRAYELSSRCRIGMYDCIYVALAEREQCELVTSDARLVKNMPEFPILLLDALV
jgi:predicted nucleic acid-binding protein